MTRGFWKRSGALPPDLLVAFPDVWVHGDWAAIDEDGLWYILGRSDDTIKIAGKRLGPAEVESVLVGHPAVHRSRGHRRARRDEGTGAGLLLRAEAGERGKRQGSRDELRSVAKRLGKPLKPKY